MDITKEIEQCTKKLIENLMAEAEWNDKMLQPREQDEWISLVKERSQAIRGFFEENEVLISKLRKYCAMPKDKALADALFESARSMVLQGRLDPRIISEVSESVIEYYIDNGDDETAIIGISIRNACLLDSYTRAKVLFPFEELEAAYRWIIGHKECYEQLQNVKARRNIFYAYQNLIMAYMLDISEERLMKAFDCLEEVKELWSRPSVRAMDGNDPEIPYIVDDLLFSEPVEIDNLLFESERVKKKLLLMLECYLEEHQAEDNWKEKLKEEMIRIRLREQRGECSTWEAVKHIESLMEQLPKVDWELDIVQSQEVLLYFSYCYIIAMRMLTRRKLHSEESEQVTRKMLSMFHQVVDRIPYSYLNSYVNEVFQSIFGTTVLNLSDAKEVEQLIYELLIYRQPSTYLHSQMVERIAVSIAKELIARSPELFCGIPGFSSADIVREKKEELLSYIAECARLHDIGKCFVTTVIMRQSRKITNDEFRCIREHPKLGLTLLEKNPLFAQYIDIIRGHHKTYDGMGGYPEDFDHTASPYRFVIELISISDAIDAATDILGRNYAKGKDFYKLLTELQDGAGSRYNPDIVRILSESEELQKEIAAYTGAKRMEYCYEAYRRCLHFDEKLPKDSKT